MMDYLKQRIVSSLSLRRSYLHRTPVGAAGPDLLREARARKLPKNYVFFGFSGCKASLHKPLRKK